MTGRVRGPRLRRAIDLDENEACRIVVLAQDVEAGDAALAPAAGGVLARGGLEVGDPIEQRAPGSEEATKLEGPFHG